MGSASSIPADKHIVIVGAGYGGAALAQAIHKMHANFTIINPGDCFQHNNAAPRAIVVPDFSEKVCIPLKLTFGDHFKQGKVTGIRPEDKKITLESGEEVAYDILVIATGTTTKLPLKTGGFNKEATMELYQKEVEKVKAAKKVVIVGGGPTGVETAAEVAAEYPDKEVTIVHSSENLVSHDLHERSQHKLRMILEEKLKIKLILGEKVTNLADIPEEGPFTLTTDKSTNIEADYILNAIGLKIETSAYGNGLGHAMEENGALKVNQFLEVVGHEGSIYAVGDCTNIKEAKLAYFAEEQAKTLAKSIKSVLNGGAPTPYKADGAPIVAQVSLGPNDGFAQLKGGSNVPSFIMVTLKSKDLLTGKTWKKLDQKCPK